MKNKIVTKLLIIVGIVAAIVGCAFVFYNNGLKATGTEEETVAISVQPGDTYYGLIETLESEGLISNAMVAKVYLKLNSDIAPLQVNDYELNKGMDLEEIFHAVSTGEFEYLLKYHMTVQEGLQLPQVAEIVAKQTGTSKQEVMDTWSSETYVRDLCEDYWFLNADEILQDDIKHPLEGYLYPETYTFTTGAPSIDYLTRIMLDMTGTCLEQYKDGMDKLGFTPHEFLSFASVVERESLFDVDRPMIAGVFKNRLDDGWNLESDITVLYVLGRTGVDLTFAEIDYADSPYNTYLYNGLPIGPISNVSDITMQSCVNYESHDYYFFYAGPDGKVYYGRDMAEHETNIYNHPW